MVHIALLGGIAHAVVLPAAPRKSAALPWMNAPTDPFFATTVGDCGFDPLGLARSPAILDYYRDAELKHSRLAMLAAVGWPASELWDRGLSTLIGAEPKAGGMQIRNECTIEIEGESKPACVAETISVVYGA